MTSRPSAPPRVLLVTPDPQYNTLGRTYCLWLLAVHLGWDVTVVTVAGTTIWEPLRDSELGRSCVTLDTTPAGLVALADRVRDSEVVIAVKPLPSTLGVVHPIAERIGRPVIVDVDDPDVEVRTIWRPARERVPRRLFQARYRGMLAMGRLAKSLPTLVSNPVLQALYGGVIVPHVRFPAEPLAARDTAEPVIRFVGSPKGHKGLEVLRAAVEAVHGEGFRLEITADAPTDARPWEAWLGATTLDRGQELVASADIVVVPSLVKGWAPGQLPAKLVDAMMYGRAVIASDIAPIRWALGDAGVLVPPGDVRALVGALRSVRDPQVRQQLGAGAHRRAVQEFSVECVAPRLAALVDELRGGLVGIAPPG